LGGGGRGVKNQTAKISTKEGKEADTTQLQYWSGLVFSREGETTHNQEKDGGREKERPSLNQKNGKRLKPLVKPLKVTWSKNQMKGSQIKKKRGFTTIQKIGVGKNMGEGRGESPGRKNETHYIGKAMKIGISAKFWGGPQLKRGGPQTEDKRVGENQWFGTQPLRPVIGKTLGEGKRFKLSKTIKNKTKY